ncbi:hypothetical protein BDV98DRAFT_220828 [Pterulicium gracile]|uniref:Uncharacterized protein n=1 Tax=Pterulicium gracile TaxID=1884261 RepID=A0A5C3Q8M4_9AGAR|nr:hypothetical protein BDV98DRAFT_220828 [Pterula gracilis]
MVLAGVVDPKAATLTTLLQRTHAGRSRPIRTRDPSSGAVRLCRTALLSVPSGISCDDEPDASTAHTRSRELTDHERVIVGETTSPSQTIKTRFFGSHAIHELETPRTPPDLFRGTNVVSDQCI